MALGHSARGKQLGPLYGKISNFYSSTAGGRLLTRAHESNSASLLPDEARNPFLGAEIWGQHSGWVGALLLDVVSQGAGACV